MPCENNWLIIVEIYDYYLVWLYDFWAYYRGEEEIFVEEILFVKKSYLN